MKYLPYIYWERKDFADHFRRQYTDALVNEWSEIEGMIYDSRWQPAFDYDGCSVIQDQLHPFLPCFIHDYRYVTQDYTRRDADNEFLCNLIMMKVAPAKALLMYLLIRAFGWYFWKKYGNKKRHNAVN